ncbi:MAG TPA: TlpA disulfide reductase family protein [Solirubrobacteraceae bacterium]|nr:TlpA disulfide reductase family protein [Solirubrobacteraceae bacterium]
MAAEAPERSPLRLVGRIAAALIGVAFVALLAYGLATKSPDRTVDDGLRASGSVGAPALNQPVLERGDLGAPLRSRVGSAFAGGHVSLAQLRGVPVVLNFWASWCDPCRAEAPVLQRAWLRERAHGVLFLGLNMQDITDDAHAFTRAVGATYPSLRDRSNGVAHRWGVTGLPETFFLSTQGRVVGHVIGAVSPSQLAAGIAAAQAGGALGVESGGQRRKTR